MPPIVFFPRSWNIESSFMTTNCEIAVRKYNSKIKYTNISSLLKSFAIRTVNYVYLRGKKTERNFILVSSRSSAGALISEKRVRKIKDILINLAS